MRNSIFNFIFN